MAFPVILVNSATGSDTAASGAGPSTALTGTTNASTDATGLVVTLGGSPDLSGVATDGSHVLFLNDSTSNVRNFGSISAVDNVAKTVTITTGEAFRASATGLSWAIGGKRASIAASPSGRLWSTASNGAGDCMPGWTVRMESGHAESGSQVTMRRAGNLASGMIILEGEENASTLPVYTSSGNGFSLAAGFIILRNFGVRKSGSSGSTAVVLSANSESVGMRVLNNSGVKFATGISLSSASGSRAQNNYIETVTGVGITLNTEIADIAHNYISGCGSFGIEITGGVRNVTIRENIIAAGSSDGIRIANTSNTSVIRPIDILKNTIHGNSGDGIEFTSSSVQTSVFQKATITSNQLTGNGGYGINFSGSSVTDDLLFALGALIANNNFGTGATGNTSGSCNLTLTLSGKDNATVDPQYTNAGSGDFSIGANTKALGAPLTAIGSGIVAGNRSYVDIGALQREETGSGGGGWGFRRRPRVTGA